MGRLSLVMMRTTWLCDLFKSHVKRIIFLMRIFLNAINEVQAANQRPVITTIYIVIAYPTTLIQKVPNPSNSAQWTIVGALRAGLTTVRYEVIVFERLSHV